MQRPQPNVLRFSVKAGIAFNGSGMVSGFVRSQDHCATACERGRAPDHGRLASD